MVGSGPEGEALVRAWLTWLGEDPERPGLRGTPARVVRAWSELIGGYDATPALTAFDEPCDEMVLLRDIEFVSICEHHLLPFVGRAHVAYVPQGRVLGISKLARLVEVYARRLQVQERLTEQLADAVMAAATPKGVGVLVEGQHLCMVARGVAKASAAMMTSAVRGVFLDKPEARAEFFALVNGPRLARVL
jgi:GTP cyclohydrolase I